MVRISWRRCSGAVLLVAVQTLSAITLLSAAATAQYGSVGASEIISCELKRSGGGAGEGAGGVCVPENLCEKGYVKVLGEGLIDRGDTRSECPKDTVCCKVRVINRKTIDECDGRCTLASECPAQQDKLGSSSCLNGKICCRVARPLCEGKCLPRGRCGDTGIDLFLKDDRCPNNGVCCQHPKPSKRRAESVKCKGKCVPDKQCLLKALSKDIKHKDDGCPLHQVCCNDQELTCNGTCTSVDKCADCFNFATEVVLLLASSSCPGDEVCCKRLKSGIRSRRALQLIRGIPEQLHTICNGTCTAQDQCLEQVSLDPKFNDHCCPVNSVCCKRVRRSVITTRSVDTDCDGECVFSQQCPTFDQSSLLDLRFSGEKCPHGKVCCKRASTEESCDGSCVFREQCEDGFNNLINLRTSASSCDGGKICCKNVKRDAETIVTPIELEVSCNGTCVPSEQCLDIRSFDLRFNEEICPLNTVCCQNPQLALVYTAQSSICDGECVAKESCPAYDQSNSINLRFSADKCPNGKVCCKNPPTAATCDGTCTFRHQCAIVQSNTNSIDLRFDAGSCGRGKVCCKQLKGAFITPSLEPEASCSGSCVPKTQCLDVGALDLRLSDDSCPLNTVCCQNPKLDLVYSFQTDESTCDGECVPMYSCPTFDQSSLLDLRLSAEKCPNGHVCCEKHPAETSCDGTCVFREQCEVEQSSANSINLRFSGSSCDQEKVCCKKLKLVTTVVQIPSQSSCRDTCVPSELCLDTGTIDLRFGQNTCPFNNVCCKNVRQVPVATPEVDDTTCDGECVPMYSCPTFDQSSFLDLRFSGEKCPFGQVCCKKSPAETSCDGTCVFREQCEVEQSSANSINLRFSGTSCDQGKVCCKKLKSFATVIQIPSQSSASCRDTCVSSALCLDTKTVDLRFGQNTCPFNNVCCKNVKQISVATPEVDDSTCNGKCVPMYSCPTFDQSSFLDLRLSTQKCPIGQVCCKTSPAETSCDGTCVFREQCEVEQSNANSINLRFSGSSCDQGKVCCKQLKRVTTVVQIPSQSSAFCRDTCVPSALCLDTRTFDLRFGQNTCPFNNVCCKNVKQVPVATPEVDDTTCDGECVPMYSCPTFDQSSFLDLRLSVAKCPFGQVCCKKSPVETSCDGTCVPRVLCEVEQSNANSINLRLSGASCDGGNVCCKNLKSATTVNQRPALADTTCRDTCVPSALCLDPQSVDLRFGRNNCPFNTVCCKNVRQTSTATTKPDQSTCDGECVFPQSCPTYDQSAFLDIRLSSDSCPFGKVCCKKSPAETSCDGTCVFRDQCELGFNVNLINLRFSAASCDGGRICCKQLKQVTESSCNGTCVPKGQCLDVAALDLRLSGSSCSNGFVCCRNPRKPMCEGQCTSIGQCQDPLPMINLRTAESICPFNQICCNNPKPFQKLCRGTCVPTNKCSKLIVDNNNFDLRLQAELCPTDQVCCQELLREEPCVCVPNNQCSDKPSFGAFSTTKCPPNQICCKNVKSVEPTCSGTCVSARECSKLSIAQGPFDLRLTNQLCPTGLVCCQEMKKAEPEAGLCSETCVPNGQCLDSSLGINLRFTDNKCPANQLCCKNPRQPPPTVTCPGQCVPIGLCPTKFGPKNNVDLRLSDPSCPSGQMCCESLFQLPSPTFGLSLPRPRNTTVLEALPPTTTSRCIFGSDPTSEKVSKADIPWLVTVWSRQELLGEQRRQYECVGVLLTTELVLTTADCVSDANRDELYVRVGDFNLKPIATLSARREYNIAEVVTHPDYNSASGQANVAILRLAKNAPKTPEVCLAQTSSVGPESTCFTLGWNKQDFTDDTATNAVPEKHFLATGSNGDCSEGFVCFDGGNGEQLQCPDKFQGSPVLCFTGGSRSWQITGLTAEENRKCDNSGVPRSFVSVGLYEMWIREQISPSFMQMKPVTTAPFYLPPF